MDEGGSRVARGLVIGLSEFLQEELALGLRELLLLQKGLAIGVVVARMAGNRAEGFFSLHEPYESKG